jgi:hypothetical protein
LMTSLSELRTGAGDVAADATERPHSCAIHNRTRRSAFSACVQ